VCWIVGALPSIAVVWYMPSRRFVVFLIPVVIIAALFVWRVWNATSAGCDAARGPAVNLPGGRWRLVCWGVIAAAWYEYLQRTLTIIYERWLHWAGWNAMALDQVCLGAGIGVIVATITGIYFVSRKPRLVLAILLACFFAVNGALNLIWYTNATFTVRDRSRELGCRTEPGEYFIDGWSWQLALENRCLPIYSPWYCLGTRINTWFVEESNRVPFLLNRDEQFDGYTLCDDVLKYPFARDRISRLEQVSLCPVVFAPDKYRYVGTIYIVRPWEDSRAPQGVKGPKKHVAEASERQLTPEVSNASNHIGGENFSQTQKSDLTTPTT
jgi:hypothetical protein